MQIDFLIDSYGVVDTEAQTVLIPAKVNGQRTKCAISIAALQELFGLEATDAADAAETFRAHRNAIEQAVREALLKNGGEPVVLTAADFTGRIVRMRRSL
jgi:hypothetical protein